MVAILACPIGPRSGQGLSVCQIVFPLVAAALLAASKPGWAGTVDDFEREPINYATAPADNPVSRLEGRLHAGQARLEHETSFGYLRSLLRELAVPESSQALVFSKTSLQRHCIGPRAPRAIYFSDEAYVGFCQAGKVLEISAVDPGLGAVFYTLEQKPDGQPHFTRQGDSCLICHGSAPTRGVPGHLVRSVFPDPTGQPLLSSGTYRIDHTSPLKQRWGGWYVTGTHGDQTHLGNLVVRGQQASLEIDNRAGLNVRDLGRRFDCTAYPNGHSDIVALMVLEHQTEAHNLLTRAGFQARQALHQEAALNRELKQPLDHRWDSTTSRIKAAGEPLVKYLLFSGEAVLTAPVQGTSSFAADFVRHGPRDSRGRSLRDFDLERRLFRYPCSYLIYSPSFDALPGEVKDYVLRRVWEVLVGRDCGKDFAHLTANDRQAVREILLATKAGLPDYWKTGTTAPEASRK